MLGKPVQVDRATITRSRVSFARICVEIDLSRPIVEEIDINVAGKQVTLKVKWDKIPLYCNECKHVGHSALTCYASGRRPMPPKRDYSHGPTPPQSRPAPTRGEDTRTPQPRQEPQSFAAAFAAGSQPHVPWQPARGHSEIERPLHEMRQPQRPDRRNQEMAASELHPTSGFFYGSSSAAAEGPQAADDDGFYVPKKKKKAAKKAAAKQRKKEWATRETQERASALTTFSDGEGQHGAEAEGSSSEGERGPRSLSPTHRSGSGVGPLAMVLHSSNNMFGALEDEPSDEHDDDSEEHQDAMITEVPLRNLYSEDPVLRLRDTSPPAEGLTKRQKFSASDTLRVSHV